MTTAAIFYAAASLVPSIRTEELKDLSNAIHDAAIAEDIDPYLLLALAFRESTLNRKAINHKTGCKGLFQIAPIHTKTIMSSLIFSASWSVKTGARILRKAYDEIGTWEGALCKFNGRKSRKCSWGRAVISLAEKIKSQALKSPGR